jgi:PAS domain-containing protein
MPSKKHKPEEIIGKPVSTLMPHDHSDEFSSIMEKLGRGERIDQFETIRRRKDGSLFNASVTISPARDAEGNLIGASAIARDITDRRLAEEERARLRGVLDSLPDPVAIKSTDGVYLECNPVFADLLGMRPDQVIGLDGRDRWARGQAGSSVVGASDCTADTTPVRRDR